MTSANLIVWSAEDEVRVKNAEMLARHWHREQTYDLFPYAKHLQDVVATLKAFCITTPDLECAGWCHDALEDRGISYSDIKSVLGQNVAEIVYAVTDELGRNRKEKKAKTYPKIIANPSALLVKLADRIANVEHGLRFGGGKVQMYAKEQSDFEHALLQENCSDEARQMFGHLRRLL